MIDKLDKWIQKQQHRKMFENYSSPLIQETIPFPEPPEINPHLSIETTLHLFDDIANQAKLDEREACAKLCEDRNYVNYVGGGFARLIRERSGGE